MKTKKHTFNFNCRGQIFSYDLIVASIIFLFILTLSIVYSNDIANRISLSESDNLRDEAVLHAANSLIYSNGSPANWENQPNLSNVSSLGIAKTRNVIDTQKLDKLIELSQTDFETAKALLGLSRYGLKISIFNLQNNQPLEKFGENPVSKQNTSTVNRFALWKGKQVLVRVEVFG